MTRLSKWVRLSSEVRITMTRRQSFFAYAALLAGVITFASSFDRTTSGQQGTTSPVVEGRYRLTTTSTTVEHVYLTDTVTGRTWLYQRGHDWFDMGSPIPAK